MKNYSILVLVIVFTAFLVGRYFTPEKIVEKIVYKDRVEYIDRVITETKTISKKGDTKVVTVTKENIKEIEKELEVIKYDTKRWSAGVGLYYDTSFNKYLSVGVERLILDNTYAGAGVLFNLDRFFSGVNLRYIF